MSDYTIAFVNPVNYELLSAEMHAALPGLITGISGSPGVNVIVNFINVPTGQQQTDATTTLNAHNPNAQTTAQANKASADAMIAAFDAVSSPVMDKVTELQGDIRTAWDNNVWDIADIFPAMRTRLMENNALYVRYRNFLRQGFGISQATFEGSPTVAQQRNSYIAAVIFLNTAGYHSLMKVFFE